jgi:hypothetical protein
LGTISVPFFMLKHVLTLGLISLSCSLASAQSNLFKFNTFGRGFHIGVGNYSGKFGDIHKELRVVSENDLAWPNEKQFSLTSVAPENSVNFKEVVGNESFRNREDAKFPIPDNRATTFTIGGYGTIGSVMLGADLNAFLGSKKSVTDIDSLKPIGDAERNYNLSTRPYAFDGVVNVGYIVLRHKGLVVYPMIGIGYGATALRLQDDRSIKQYPIYGLHGDNVQNSVFWNHSLVYDFGIGTQFYVGKSDDEEAKGFSIGLKLGFRSQTESDAWRINGKSVESANENFKFKLNSLGNNGLYVKLLIGFGRLGERN